MGVTYPSLDAVEKTYDALRASDVYNATLAEINLDMRSIIRFVGFYVELQKLRSASFREVRHVGIPASPTFGVSVGCRGFFYQGKPSAFVSEADRADKGSLTVRCNTEFACTLLPHKFGKLIIKVRMLPRIQWPVS
jgi:hypothetical protein